MDMDEYSHLSTIRRVAGHDLNEVLAYETLSPLARKRLERVWNAIFPTDNPPTKENE